MAEAALRDVLADMDISSAGLHALVGHGIDADSAAAARHHGIALSDHAARQFNTRLGEGCDLILAMAQDHRNEIAGRWPQFSGKTMLLGHFEKGKDIPDPYRMGAGMHLRAVEMICESVDHWRQQLAAMRE